jgi:hypothetical protein
MNDTHERRTVSSYAITGPLRAQWRSATDDVICILSLLESRIEHLRRRSTFENADPNLFGLNDVRILQSNRKWQLEFICERFHRGECTTGEKHAANADLCKILHGDTWIETPVAEDASDIDLLLRRIIAEERLVA